MTSPAVRTIGLRHLALKVRDLAAMSRFYQDVFGMRVVWQPDAQNCYLSSGTDNLALHHDADAGSGGALDHLGFLMASPEDVRAAAQAVTQRGVPIVKPLKVHRDDSVSFYCSDPDGNVIQVLYVPGTVA